ncbi:hypothetical protein UFOVP260_55 [uncultured Caudovirales phage]|uniref:Uncharacterized protein n=1 Tax=uncultured Caudovirales phage TaxID=2100421 RepID=A0A6J7WCM7_9CAUD|nr:hypothetical protein UFOVP85_7 [uncultured Caudovirales phage]CAB4132696.1 hypothetical protein UFOVP260_55 [uncultured Caudovirales phage]CAB4202970.1 hypothetical protein UFOVP1363_50 [uncultured Caudovirales phage]CAB5207143.1 hypothetical protein UFOVP179_24 [uncultured Caudovirales phage]
MSERVEELMVELNKSKAEFDIATTCVAQALQSMCERLDKVELWIESQKPQQN